MEKETNTQHLCFECKYLSQCPMGIECKYKENLKHSMYYHHCYPKMTDQEAFIYFINADWEMILTINRDRDLTFYLDFEYWNICSQ